jgi:hypothetical protein
MTHSRRTLLAIVLLLSIPVSLFGHATVSPASSRPGAYERYVLRVPNESDNATVRVEITFPATVRVISFLDVPGWTLAAQIDNSGRAVTGTLAPERFVEFPFVAVNPGSAAKVSWPVIQTYANGDKIEWSGPAGSDHPASVTAIGGNQIREWLPTAMASLALLVALAALVRPKP